MTRARLFILAVICLTSNCAVAGTDSAAVPQSQGKGDDSLLEGTWLPHSADGWDHSVLSDVRASKLVIRGHSYALSKYRDLTKDVTGTFSIDPTANPKTIDIHSEEIDLSPGGEPVKYPAALVPGIYKIEGDVLTVCFATGEDRKRPPRFAETRDGTILLVLRRADPDFRDYPKQVTVTVLNPDGSPAAGASVFGFMGFAPDRKNPTAPPQWKYYTPRTAGPSGTLSIPFDQFTALGARDTARKLIGFTTASPAQLQKGALTIRLAPECLVSGKLVCDVLAKEGKSIGWTNVYLLQDGQRLGMSMSMSGGDYQFPVPAGQYTLLAYGTNLHKRFVPITVPGGQGGYHPPPIELEAAGLELLKGHPAPELSGVVGWKGTPTKLRDLRGKYVLIDFWGYWCGPCVEAMPVLMDLHEKYKDKGLAILSVHVDIDGDVDTVAKLDEKTAEYRKKLWNGRDLPFPTALSKGQDTPDGYDGLTAQQYGILSYPTTVLIDRDGNVVDRFEARDGEAASAEIERLLGSGK